VALSGEALAHPGANRGGPVDLSTARRILAVRADNIGDVVLVTPALRALRAAAPRARLDLLASPVGALVAPMIAELDGVLTVSASWQQLGGGADDGSAARRERELLARLTAARYDAMFVFTSFSQSPWPVAQLGLLAGIGTRVVHSREFGGAVATHWVTPPPDTAHQVDRTLHLLAGVGIADRGPLPALRVPAAAERAAADLLRGVLPNRDPDADRGSGGRRFAVLAPGASCAARRYPAVRFGQAAAGIAAAGLPVLVAGSEREAGLVAEVVDTARSAGGAAIGSAGRPDVTTLPAVPLEVFTALLRRAAVAITNNSGGMHLADAMGTPVAVTYAGTELPGDLRPRSVPAELLGRAVPCSPCRQLRCPYRHECLDVAPAELTAAALRLAGPSTTPQITPPTEEDRWLPHPAMTRR
jgi:ADP-heptose:LPS heptosyltransferase